MKRFAAIALFLLTLSVIRASAQTAAPPGGPGVQVTGEVTALNSQSKKITVKTDRGAVITLSVAERAPLRRVPAGAKDLTTAARIDLSDIAVGDRVVARAQKSGDQPMTANSIIVMAKADVELQRQREQDDWRKRGTTGIVTAVDSVANTFTIKVGQTSITIRPESTADFRRYAPDSVKFSDARPSSLAAIKTGDQVRVLGDKSDDSTSIKATRVVSGSFRQIAGTISSINVEAGEVAIKDLASKKQLVVRVNAASAIRRMPEQVAASLARRYQPGRSSTAGPGGSSDDADIGQMPDRLMPISLSELKPGDAIMLSATTGADPTRVTAITLLAGVEPLLTASPDAARDIMAGWNLGGAEE